MERIGIINNIGATLALRLSLGKLFDRVKTREQIFNAIENKLIRENIEFNTMQDIVKCVKILIADKQWLTALKVTITN